MAEIERQGRFKDAPWFPDKDERVIVGGSGGIGSWVSFFLARAGFKPFIFDFDTVEVHNVGGQLLRNQDIGRFKVDAVKDIIKMFSGEVIDISTQPITTNSPSHIFMVSAFDNMQARKDMFEVWKRSIHNSPVTPLYIDGRLLMEQVQIFCVTPDTISDYEEFLFEDSDVDDAPCTMRQTSHSAALIGSLMTAFFTNHIANIYERQTVREVPFYYEYFIPANLTINTP